MIKIISLELRHKIPIDMLEIGFFGIEFKFIIKISEI